MSYGSRVRLQAAVRAVGDVFIHVTYRGRNRKGGEHGESCMVSGVIKKGYPRRPGTLTVEGLEPSNPHFSSELGLWHVDFTPDSCLSWI